jgi:hypothetical protein
MMSDGGSVLVTHWLLMGFSMPKESKQELKIKIHAERIKIDRL